MTKNKRFIFVIDNGEPTFYDLSEKGEIMNMTDTEEMLNELSTENRQLKKQIESEHQMLDNAILLERTRMGQSALKQYKEAIQ